MNRQRYMAELSKLLSFMFKEDRSEILQHYNELLDNAEDEDALLEEFGSPTKLAVTIFRNYERDDLKLSVNAESKDGSVEETEFSSPSASQFRTFKASSPEKDAPENEISSASYVDIIEEIRREIAEENGTEYVPIFFDELDEDKIDVQEPAEEEVEDPAPEAEPEVEEAPEVEDAPAVEDTPEVEETLEVEDVPKVEAVSEDEEIPEVEEAPEVEDAPAVEDTPEVEETLEAEDVPEVEEAAGETAEESEEAAQEQEPVEESAPSESAEEEEMPESAAEEDAEESESEPVSEETEPVAEETVTDPPVEEAQPEAGESVTEPVPEELIPDEPDDEIEIEMKLSAGLLILYLIFAIPIGLVLLIALAAVTLAVLGGAVAAVAGGVLLVSFALSGITVAADMILILGGALVAFAVGLLLVWTGFWLILSAFHGLVNLIIRLGGRICMKEAVR